MQHEDRIQIYFFFSRVKSKACRFLCCCGRWQGMLMVLLLGWLFLPIYIAAGVRLRRGTCFSSLRLLTVPPPSR